MIQSWEAMSNHDEMKKIATEKEFKMILDELKLYRNDISVFQSSGTIFQYIAKAK